MKNNYSVTQVLAYHSVDLKGQQFKVVQAMRNLIHTGIPMTRENIASEARIKETSACARIKELRNRGIVEIGTDVKGSSGKWVECYKLAPMGQVSFI